MTSKIFNVELKQLENTLFLEDLIRENFHTINWIDSTYFVDDNVFCLWNSKEKSEHYEIIIIAKNEKKNVAQIRITKLD